MNIVLSTSLLILSEEGGILSITAKSLSEESSMKSISQKLINFPGVSRSSRQYPFNLSVYHPSIWTFTTQDYSFLSCTGFGTWVYPIDPKIHKWDTSGFHLVQAS